MPPVERDRLHGLISKEAWARADHARLKMAASTDDVFAAALLYALDGDPRGHQSYSQIQIVSLFDRDMLSLPCAVSSPARALYIAEFICSRCRDFLHAWG